MTIDYYKVLQVDPKAESEVILAAYDALAASYKDDKKKLKLLNEAKDILSDPKDRARLDKESNPKGKIIGDYRILDEIAEGGFGTTYKAEHITLQTPVCIKHALNISPMDEAILLDEARLISDLRHWGIPAVKGVLRMPDKSLALVMSYVPGPTLAQIIEKNPDGLDPEHVAWITERTLNILHYLHLHGVVHGDVKPQNIIIQPKSHTVVLVDYGLSTLKPNSKTINKGYTPYFAAPEQIDGRTPIPETDFYGLGMTMIFALGGDVKAIRVPESTPSGMCELIKRFIRRDPLARPRWENEDLTETIKAIRKKDFGRAASDMKPLNF